MRATTGQFRSHQEVDGLTWLHTAAARRTLTSERDLSVLDAFDGEHNDTWPLAVVRHASAGDRASWTGPDVTRPLDRRGLSQAELLGRLLAAYEPAVLVSAPALRCADTLAPLAKATGLPLRREALLGEEGHKAEPFAAQDLVSELARGQAPVVLCSQRGPLPDLVQGLAKQLGSEVTLELPEKGTATVLHLASEPELRLVAWELLELS